MSLFCRSVVVVWLLMLGFVIVIGEETRSEFVQSPLHITFRAQRNIHPVTRFPRALTNGLPSDSELVNRLGILRSKDRELLSRLVGTLSRDDIELETESAQENDVCEQEPHTSTISDGVEMILHAEAVAVSEVSAAGDAIGEVQVEDTHSVSEMIERTHDEQRMKDTHQATEPLSNSTDVAVDVTSFSVVAQLVPLESFSESTLFITEEEAMQLLVWIDRVEECIEQNRSIILTAAGAAVALLLLVAMISSTRPQQRSPPAPDQVPLRDSAAQSEALGELAVQAKDYPLARHHFQSALQTYLDEEQLRARRSQGTPVPQKTVAEIDKLLNDEFSLSASISSPISRTSQSLCLEDMLSRYHENISQERLMASMHSSRLVLSEVVDYPNLDAIRVCEALSTVSELSGDLKNGCIFLRSAIAAIDKLLMLPFGSSSASASAAKINELAVAEKRVQLEDALARLILKELERPVTSSDYRAGETDSPISIEYFASLDTTDRNILLPIRKLDF